MFVDDGISAMTKDNQESIYIPNKLEPGVDSQTPGITCCRLHQLFKSLGQQSSCNRFIV